MLGIKIKLQIETRSISYITELYLWFYPEKVKVIPRNIYDLLRSRVFGHLIMRDGSLEPHSFILCTYFYTVEDIVRLMNLFIIKLRLECLIRVRNENKIRIDLCLW